MNSPKVEGGLDENVEFKKFTISGVEVEFPTKPYPTQLSVMQQIIRGLRSMQNCLLESPTGTGKTLALICSALGWQKAEAARLEKISAEETAELLKKLQMEEKLKMAEQLKKRQEEMKQPQVEKQKQMLQQEVKRQDTVLHVAARRLYEVDSDEEDLETFFQASKKSKMSCNNIFQEVKVEDKNDTVMIIENPQDTEQSMMISDNYNLAEESLVLPSCCGNVFVPPLKPRAPQIFYGTRTHQQITQVIRELRKTSYKNIKMTILSSREHTCIQNPRHGKKYSSKTEMCQEYLDPIEGTGCYFNSNVMRISTHELLQQSTKLEMSWNIEDLVKAGRKVKACPYFAARELMKSSDIIFCPYNYLIDPLIRKSMNIPLNGAIVLLDEAHNIEDTCREAASITLEYDSLCEAINNCNLVAQLDILPATHVNLANFLKALLSWFEAHIMEFQKRNDVVWTGIYFVASLEKYGITAEEVKNFQDCANEAIKETMNEEHREEARLKNIRYGIATATKIVLENLSLVLSFIYSNNLEHMKDYVVTISCARVNHRSRTRITKDSWQARVHANVELVKAPHFDAGYMLNFLCLYSGVVFAPIAKAVRSVVLTSGTLAPVGTFQSELNVEFPIQFEGRHVIDPAQVWIGSLPCGPSGYPLNATFRCNDDFAFKTELGNVITKICAIIPNGVLCFLPSYSLLENLRTHWMNSGMWETLSELKDVMCETRGSEGFEATIQSFYTSVKFSEQGHGRGPILFAIMRGKVSEGLDFADNNARAVITIGIPYPSFMDVTVKEKRKYNDDNTQHGLKSGKEWYETQAYRALNQALGRCIRHRNDWGAIIMIDSRFCQRKEYTAGLSKWLREKLQHYANWESMYTSLQNFMEHHKDVQELEAIHK